ncbi:unnamed protein product [Allacma fusca]|uniref:Uncharacterized protein n=1 Tax=Allacma fusca TaxID=39272 RepID=A0A8J2KL88_9HEXA|nr:unnamed protein product [Allacma fusca]
MLSQLIQMTSALITLFVKESKLYIEFHQNGTEKRFERGIMKVLLAKTKNLIFYGKKHGFKGETQKTKMRHLKIVLNDLKRNPKWVNALQVLEEFIYGVFGKPFI